jgi:hypothetical protein
MQNISLNWKQNGNLVKPLLSAVNFTAEYFLK